MPSPQVVVQEPAEPIAPAAPVIQTTQGRTQVVLPGGQTITVPGSASPRAIYQAAQAKREAIRDLIERARNRREEISNQLRNPNVTGADRTGLERRISEMDLRIIDLEKQLVEAENQIVAAAAIPNAVPGPREGPGPRGREGPPEEVFVVVPVLIVMFVLFPMAIAWSRRLWKRAEVVVGAVPHALMERFGRLEQNVDAMAIEIERISEGQRFMTKLFAEQGTRGILQGSEVGAERVAEG